MKYTFRYLVVTLTHLLYKMSRPTARVNTFFVDHKKTHVDVVSKIFIICEAILGLDLLPLIGKRKFIYRFMTFILHIVWSSLVIYYVFEKHSHTIMGWTKLIQYSICTILSFMRCKWLLMYYSKLNDFDTGAGCQPRTPNECIRNVVQAGAMILVVIAIFTIYPSNSTFYEFKINSQFVPLHIVYVLELYFLGHRLALLVQRLKLINYYIESSLSTATTISYPIAKDFVYFKPLNRSREGQSTTCCMRKLMDLYELVVEAYDFLIEGIKWQFLVVIITSFIIVLGLLYIFSLGAIRSGEILSQNAMLQVGMTTVIMIPLFAPCTFGDCVHSEVKKLRELLASKLYENKLDKSGRGVARALLAFTETRDMSFRLLRMLNIDISLPFKFAGLLVTYLIILLQFEKVINS